MNKTIAVYGDTWRKLLTRLCQTRYLPDYHANLIQYASKPADVMAALETWFKEPTS
jgi:hypothetical protein